MPPTKSKYVKCRVSLGFFETEFYVVVDSLSANVDRQDVKIETLPEIGKQVDGQVLAYVIEEKNDQALVELPGESVVGGPRTWIPITAIA